MRKETRKEPIPEVRSDQGPQPPAPSPLRPGEVLYVAKVVLLLNRGKMRKEPGDTVILGPEDAADGINIRNLERNGGIERFTTQERADELKNAWLTGGRQRRRSLKARNAAAERRAG